MQIIGSYATRIGSTEHALFQNIIRFSRCVNFSIKFRVSGKGENSYSYILRSSPELSDDCAQKTGILKGFINYFLSLIIILLFSRRIENTLP